MFPPSSTLGISHTGCERFIADIPVPIRSCTRYDLTHGVTNILNNINDSSSKVKNYFKLIHLIVKFKNLFSNFVEGFFIITEENIFISRY